MSDEILIEGQDEPILNWLAKLDDTYICTEIFEGIADEYCGSDKYVKLESEDTTVIGKRYNWSTLGFEEVVEPSKSWYAGLNDNDICYCVAYVKDEIYGTSDRFVKLVSYEDIKGKKYNRETKGFELAPMTAEEEREQYLIDLDFRLSVAEIEISSVEGVTT